MGNITEVLKLNFAQELNVSNYCRETQTWYSRLKS